MATKDKNKQISLYAKAAWQSLFVGLHQYDIVWGQDYTGIEVHNSIMVLSYKLKMINTSKWRKMQGLVPELSQMVQLDNGRGGGVNGDKVRISYQGLTYRIEVPKIKDFHNPISVRDVFQKSKGLDVNIGISAYSNQLAGLNFNGQGVNNTLISGATRCGKTNVLKIIAMSLAYNNSPDKIRFAIIDVVKCREKYGMLENSAHLAVDLIDTPNKALALLNWLKDTIIAQQGAQLSYKLVILIDEIYLLMKKNPEVTDLIEYIASAGSEVGIHLVSASQYVKTDDLGGRQTKGNFMTRICGKVDDEYSSRNAIGESGAENLMKPGDFIISDDDGVNRIAVPEFNDRLFNRIPRGMSPVAKLNWDSHDIGQIPGTGSVNIAACFDKIDPRLLSLAINGRKDGRCFGADVIRKASYVLSKKGLGDRIGQGTANQYVKYAKRYREINGLK